MLFLACFCTSQRVQRRKAELTLAQIREKLENGWADWHQIWHTYANSYENGYTPNKLPLETQGGTWRVLGGLGRDILITSRPSTPHGGIGRGGGLGCHKCKSLHWEAVKRLYRIRPKSWHTTADASGNGYTPNKITPRALGGWHSLRGQTFKSLGKLSNGWTDWHQLWFTSAYSSGNVHRLNPSRPSIPQEAVRGGGRGSQIQKSWEAVAT